MIALEWKELVRERGTVWILGALLLASVIALAQGVAHYRRQATCCPPTNERRMSGLAAENLAFGSDGNCYGPLDAPRIVGIEMEAKF